MERKLLCILCLYCSILTCNLISSASTGSPKHPLILVPGDGGSQFQGKLNKSSVVHIWCTKFTKDWFPLWLNLELLVPYALDCFTDNMKLFYDEKTHTTRNSPGVLTRQLGFGNTSTVEWLDSSHFTHTQYFSTIVEGLVKNAGYERNVNIRGAPYDFRKAPNEMQEYVTNLVKLVEDTYHLNGNRKVVLLGHSMGNMYSLYMLYRQPQSWKDTYIQSFISLAGPWGGAVKTLRLMASGDDLGVFVLNPLSVRTEQRSMPSTAWLLPYDTFWNSSEILVYGPERNYTVNDYKQFFNDIDYKTGYLMRQDTENLMDARRPPGVEVHCLHGHGLKTPAALHYTKAEWYDQQPDLTFGDGDATVNMRSLLGCLEWDGKQPQKIYHRQFKDAEHMQIMHNKDVLAYIQNMLS